MRSRLVIKVLLMAALVLVLAACAEPPPPTQEEVAEEAAEIADILSLSATAWQVVTLGGPGNELPLIEGSTPTLNFFVERYAGFSGCNYYLAAYSIDGNSISLLGPTQTILQCAEPEGVMEQEATFIGILQNATEFDLEGETLTLFTVGEQPLATFTRAENLPLEGTTWQLKFYVVDEEITPIIEGSEVTAIFEGDAVSGSGGCNNYNGTVAVDGSNLTVSGVASTMMACNEPAGVMDQEAAFLSQLENAASFELGGSTLIVANADNEPIMLFAVQE